MQSLINYLYGQGAMLVGSRAWGGETRTSDYDFIVTAAENEALKNNLPIDCVISNSPPTGSGGSNTRASYYIQYDGAQFNIIVLRPEVKRCWLQTSDMMRNFPRDKIGNRTLRRFIFTLLVDTFVHLG